MLFDDLTCAMCYRLDLDLNFFTGTAFRQQIFYRNGVPDRSGLLSPLTITINVYHLYCQIFTLKLTKFLKNVHDHQALPIILPYTILFTKQSNFKKASGTKMFKYKTKIRQALRSNKL